MEELKKTARELGRPQNANSDKTGFGEKITNFISTIFSAVIGILLTVIFIINFSSSIVGGIWLAFLGEWALIGVSLLFICLMPLAFGIVNLPSTGLMFFALYLTETRIRFLTPIPAFLGSFYTNAIITLWVFYIFGFVIEKANDVSYIPYLLWAYSTVMAPLSYMTSHNPPDSFSITIALLLAQLCFLTISICFYIGGLLNEMVYIILSIIFIFSSLTAIMSFSLTSKNA